MLLCVRKSGVISIPCPIRLATVDACLHYTVHPLFATLVVHSAKRNGSADPRANDRLTVEEIFYRLARIDRLFAHSRVLVLAFHGFIPFVANNFIRLTRTLYRRDRIDDRDSAVGSNEMKLFREAWYTLIEGNHRVISLVALFLRLESKLTADRIVKGNDLTLIKNVKFTFTDALTWSLWMQYQDVMKIKLIFLWPRKF